jgi:hypothetical protein
MNFYQRSVFCLLSFALLDLHLGDARIGFRSNADHGRNCRPSDGFERRSDRQCRGHAQSRKPPEANLLLPPIPPAIIGSTSFLQAHISFAFRRRDSRPACLPT